jgi:hypothetical protein
LSPPAQARDFDPRLLFLAQVSVQIHALMKDADDRDPVVGLLIENDVTARDDAATARPNFVARRAETRIPE